MRADAADVYGSGQGFRPGAGPNQGQPGQHKELTPSTRGCYSIESLALAALDSVPLPELIKYACGTVSHQLSVEYVALLELGVDNQLLLREGVGWGQEVVGNATVSTGLSSQAGYTLLQHGPVIVDDLQKEKRFHCDKLLEHHGVRSGITVGVPSNHSELCGTLGAHSTTPRSFTEEEAHFVTEVAKILGNAMEQRKLEGRARYAEERFGALVHASSLLAASPGYDTALSYAAQIALDHLADWCFVDVAAPQNHRNDGSCSIHRLVRTKTPAEPCEDVPQELHYNYLLEATLRHGTPGVLCTGQPETISPVHDELLRDISRNDGHLQLLRQLDPGTYMCVPMQARQRLIGAIGFVCGGPHKRYGEEDLALAGSLARYTALAIDSSLNLSEGKAVSGELTRRIKRHEPVVSTPEHQNDRLGLQDSSRSRERISYELSPREMEVLRSWSMHKSARQIARELGVTEGTVSKHTEKIRKVFGVDRTWQAAIQARELGLIPMDHTK